ncbi:hypothetical protein SELR_13620 [Selenomonas ruminantium subsp. lactilytica TAM6421]|uniref:Sel1 repeat-containing protein n=1 Tax=Selenomonas ruminantium subsp. lactilytica (strain NBRC 103574 / TAM6421) TaxID=927704 RepID=I0GQN3_SELRL|nr:sel1 repeat family protein [Selenomonas ruminantium]BAL83070.1 hypothetical protein SELR_13620 [Selenomonas ruminantium subsp. lactilytica TAM6421]
MTCFIPPEFRVKKEFDEEKFFEECMREFSNIRRDLQLDDETLKKAQRNQLLERYTKDVMKGCTVEGIKEMAKSVPDCDMNKGWCFGSSFISFSPLPVFDPTEEKVRCMIIFYREKCVLLRGRIEQVQGFERIICDKEKKVADGDVAAMFFLGKAYEEGRICVKDKEKSLAYYQQAKDTWAGYLSRRYEKWLDKAVQDSGLEMIGRIGREYIAGNFAQTAKKNRDSKLKKEVKWLTKAIDDGDGWAAFTKGNICFYGYGRWGTRKKEAYNNYLKAAKSKDSIYAMELGEF